ncbi:MAG TPA: hypothetical protein VGL04_05560 [Sporichthyaceae bacterium]
MGVMDQAKNKAEDLKNKAEGLAEDMKDKVHHKADEHGQGDKTRQAEQNIRDATQK